mgnify:CR=1 FL=1
MGWEEQVIYVKEKAEKRLKKFKSVLSNRRLPVKLRLNVHKTFVLTTLMYGLRSGHR